MNPYSTFELHTPAWAKPSPPDDDPLFPPYRLAVDWSGGVFVERDPKSGEVISMGFRPRKQILQGTVRRWVSPEIQQKANKINSDRSKKAWRTRKRRGQIMAGAKTSDHTQSLD